MQSMDREASFSIEECISECMQNRIDTSEALDRMKAMQQHMPGLNYSGDKGIRQAVSQSSYMQTGPPVFPEPIPSSTMRHPGPQYFEENRVMAHSQGASLIGSSPGFGGFVQNRFPTLVEGFPGNPFAQHSPLPLNQNQMGFNQMGFNRQMPTVFQKPETSTGFQKPGESSSQFQNPETAIAVENLVEKTAASKKKDKQAATQKIIAQKTDTQATSQAMPQAASQAVTGKKDFPVNPLMPAKAPAMIPFAKVR